MEASGILLSRLMPNIEVVIKLQCEIEEEEERCSEMIIPRHKSMFVSIQSFSTAMKDSATVD